MQTNPGLMLLVSIAIWLPLLLAALVALMLFRLLSKQTIMHRAEWYWRRTTRNVWIVVACASTVALLVFSYAIWRCLQVWALTPGTGGDWIAFARAYAPYAGVTVAVAAVAPLFLLPAIWLWTRRLFLWKIRFRRSSVPDVVTLEQAEVAIQRRAAVDTAARYGLVLDSRSNSIRPSDKGDAVFAPHPIRKGTSAGFAFAVVIDKMLTATRQENPDWQVGNTLIAPRKPGDSRAVVIAESGAGKTELLNSIMLCHREQQHTVVFIDGKGDQNDADKLARSHGADVHNGGYDFFSGSPDDVLERLMRLIPVTETTTFYADEARDIIGRVLIHWDANGGASDFEEFSALWDIAVAEELDDIDNRKGVPYLTEKVQGNERNRRVWVALQKGFAQVRSFHSSRGWTLPELLESGGFHVIPIVAEDEADVLLANLLMHDMRRYLAVKKRNKQAVPGVMAIDEFAQIVRENLSDMPAPKMAASMFETTRSLNMGLYIAGQSLSAIAEEESMQKRLVQAGAALIVGRGKDAEIESNAFGTVFHAESTGDAEGVGAKSTRAQHTYRVNPNWIRELPNGSFYFSQRGSVRQVVVLPAAR